MRHLAQARNPYSLSWLWIPCSLVSLAPRNDAASSIRDHHRPEFPVRRLRIADGSDADAARARHQQILAMAGRVFPLLQHLREAEKPRADIFRGPRFAQRSHTPRKVAAGAVADGAGCGHRARLLQRHRAETAVQL